MWLVLIHPTLSQTRVWQGASTVGRRASQGPSCLGLSSYREEKAKWGVGALSLRVAALGGQSTENGAGSPSSSGQTCRRTQSPPGSQTVAKAEKLQDRIGHFSAGLFLDLLAWGRRTRTPFKGCRSSMPTSPRGLKNSVAPGNYPVVTVVPGELARVADLTLPRSK